MSGIYLREFWNQIGLLDKVDLFITHGGMGSYQEALWKGVPLIVRPISYDQFLIAHEVERLGFGLKLPEETDIVTLKNSIEKVLTDEDFKKRVSMSRDWFDSNKTLQVYMNIIDKFIIK